MKLSLEQWIIVALAGLIVVLLGAFGYQKYQRNKEQVAAMVCKTDRANFAATQTGNLQTIADLTHRLAVLAEARKVEADAAAKAVLEAEKLAMTADQKSERLASELESLYAHDAGAQSWGSAGVDAGVAAKLPGADR